MGINKSVSSILKKPSVVDVMKHRTAAVAKGNTACQEQPAQDEYLQVVQLRKKQATLQLAHPLDRYVKSYICRFFM